KSREDFMSGITEEFLEKTISEILGTTQKDIADTWGSFADFLKTSSKSAIGNAEKIRLDKEMFSELIDIN
ncbi:MAG: hypothetical protein KKD38_01750, partial [Candidatus Delongbacteria bacterium]|nr:hypothetical protein [Candidatus Delongbacteria bacterium]MCG2759748.1 hypothetical protein [Candidatus Delongbacteria bacterium]